MEQVVGAAADEESDDVDGQEGNDAAEIYLHRHCYSENHVQS